MESDLTFIKKLAFLNEKTAYFNLKIGRFVR